MRACHVNANFVYVQLLVYRFLLYIFSTILRLT